MSPRALKIFHWKRVRCLNRSPTSRGVWATAKKRIDAISRPRYPVRMRVIGTMLWRAIAGDHLWLAAFFVGTTFFVGAAATGIFLQISPKPVVPIAGASKASCVSDAHSHFSAPWTGLTIRNRKEFNAFSHGVPCSLPKAFLRTDSDSHNVHFRHSELNSSFAVKREMSFNPSLLSLKRSADVSAPPAHRAIQILFCTWQA
jgi:hypothetical protein